MPGPLKRLGRGAWLLAALVTLAFWGAPPSAVASGTEPDVLSEVNRLRDLASLQRLRRNSALNRAAQGHANYIASTGTLGHLQSPGIAFYGVNPGDRAVRAGYRARRVVEVASLGERNPTRAVQGFVDALYHRMGLFSLDTDQTGVSLVHGPQGTAVVVVAGTSSLVSLCRKAEKRKGRDRDKDEFGDDLLYQRVVTGGCAKVEGVDSEDWHGALARVRASGPALVVWPFPDAHGVRPVAKHEVPSPMDLQGDYGYPISAQFNPARLGEVEVRAFELTDVSEFGGGPVEARFFSRQQDPNNLLADGEFALVPLQPLRYGATYQAFLRYVARGRVREQTWQFHTQALPWKPLQLSRAVQAQPEWIRPGEKRVLELPPGYSVRERLNLDVTKDKGFELDTEPVSQTMLVLEFKGEVCAKAELRYLDFGSVRVRLAPEEGTGSLEELCLEHYIASLPGMHILGLGETVDVRPKKASRVVLSVIPRFEGDELGTVRWAARESLELEVEQSGPMTLVVRMSSPKEGDAVPFRLGGNRSFTLRVR